MILIHINKIINLHRWRLHNWVLLMLVVCAIPKFSGAQTELTGNAVSSGAAMVNGGAYSGYVSAGQPATYMYANGSFIATQGIILNEISANVQFTFELSGTLTQNTNAAVAQLVLKSSLSQLAGTALSGTWIYLVLAADSTVYDSVQTQTDGSFLFSGVPFRNYFFMVGSPVISPTQPPVMLNFEDNPVFVKEVEIFGEVGTAGQIASTSVVITPQQTSNSQSPDDLILWYLDADKDGFGNPLFSVKLNKNSQQAGYVVDNLDCNDNDASANPSGTDIPGSGIDGNCDGIFLWFVDADGDGFGSSAIDSSLLDYPATGQAGNNLDCDDFNPAINPAMADIAGSGMDANCDGYYRWFVDVDGDGFGSEQSDSTQSNTPQPGFSALGNDCDDTNSDVYPEAPEPPNSRMDYNCDGFIPCAGIEISGIFAPANPVDITEEVVLSATIQGDSAAVVSWNWGDGTVSEGTFGNGTVNGSHWYTQSGLYEISLTVANVCNDTDEKMYSFLVVVDYCEGDTKVEAKGKIKPFTILASTKKKDKNDIKLKFKAEIEVEENEFESELEFWYDFKAGDFKFTGEQIDWLIINNNLAFAGGTGKLNNVSGYTFLVSIQKNKKAADYFRLLVFDEFGIIVYDTQPGEPVLELPSTPISKSEVKLKNACDKKHKGNDEDDDKHSIANNSGFGPGNQIEIKAYPNPTKGRVYLDIKNEMGPFKIEISNLSGQKVFVNEYKSSNRVELNLGGNAAGIYLIRLISNEHQAETRIILGK